MPWQLALADSDQARAFKSGRDSEAQCDRLGGRSSRTVGHGDFLRDIKSITMTRYGDTVESEQSR